MVDDELSTPRLFFDRLNGVYDFNLDPCCSEENKKCKKYFTKEMDGLSWSWKGRVFVNPPYSRGNIRRWLLKGLKELIFCECIVFLLPVDTSTKWFHEIVLPNGDIEFIKGRLKFGDYENSPRFANMLVTFPKGYVPISRRI